MITSRQIEGPVYLSHPKIRIPLRHKYMTRVILWCWRSTSSDGREGWFSNHHPSGRSWGDENGQGIAEKAGQSPLLPIQLRPTSFHQHHCWNCCRGHSTRHEHRGRGDSFGHDLSGQDDIQCQKKMGRWSAMSRERWVSTLGKSIPSTSVSNPQPWPRHL
jgi:hypothetical protein